MQGGLTHDQIVGLYEYKLKEDEEHLRFQAAIHGAKLKETGRVPVSSKNNLEKVVPMFGDPEDYDSMSQEKREELTKKMMGKHKVWAGQSGLGAKESK